MKAYPEHVALRVKPTRWHIRFFHDTSPRGRAPLLGQHNREIAGELGLSASDLDAMARDGVLYKDTRDGVLHKDTRNGPLYSKTLS